MARPAQPAPVKIICGMISSREELFEAALARLTEALGPVDITSDILPFDFTHYYDEQMGAPLYRRFAGFERLRLPDELVAIKLRTNELEREIAAEVRDAPPRPINLDPGYISESKLVLASMKDFSHRLYLGSGVYGEVTLMFHKGKWESLRWSFPDYASGRYDAFLTAARDALRRSLARANQENRE